MSKILFRGSFFRHAVIQDDESGVFVRAHVTADFSEPVAEEMGWEIGKGQDGGDLMGRLDGSGLIMTPASKELEQHQLQLICSEIADFKWKKVQEKGEDSSHYELRFIVRLPGEGAAALIENFKRRVGKEKSALQVEYTAGTQRKLDMEPEPEVDDRQQSLIDDDQEPIGEFLQGEAREQHEAATAEPEDSNGPIIAPAALMGGTHQRGTRGRRPRNPAAEAIADGTAKDEAEEEEQPA